MFPLHQIFDRTTKWQDLKIIFLLYFITYKLVFITYEFISYNL